MQVAADFCYDELVAAVRYVHNRIETADMGPEDTFENPLHEVDTEAISRGCFEQVYMPTVRADNNFGSQNMQRAADLIEEAIEGLEEISAQPVL